MPAVCAQNNVININQWSQSEKCSSPSNDPPNKVYIKIFHIENEPRNFPEMANIVWSDSRAYNYQISS